MYIRLNFKSNMKKARFILLFVMAAGASTFFSCKKCLKCSYVEPSQLTTERESCGNKDQLELFKADVIKEAEGFGVDEGEVTCVDSK